MTVVYCTTRFVAFHRWASAPDSVAFLRDRHRHEFHVRAEYAVDHEDRDVEFISKKVEVDEAVRVALCSSDDTETWSCERWARWIGEWTGACAVDVSEDGENGARWSA